MILNEELKFISPQYAKDSGFFGPVYHGSTSDKLSQIDSQGFKITVGSERSGDVSHEYESGDYYSGIPAPIHHMGYGIYFTTVKSIAKRFSYGNPNIGPYFLDAPRIETINWGSPRTMMKWWIENGYDYKKTPQTTFGNNETDLFAIRQERMRATVHMTAYLKERYDVVWYKGKGISRLLDGDQVVVFNPAKIYKLDKTLAKPGEIGSTVISKVGIDPYSRGTVVVPIGTKGVIVDKKKPNEHQKCAEGSEWIYSIKYEKGGVQWGILDSWIEPYIKSSKKTQGLTESQIQRRSFWKVYETVHKLNKTDTSNPNRISKSRVLKNIYRLRENDSDHWEALRKTGYFGNEGAGAIILAQDTGRILLPYRSISVEQPHTWGAWGGAINKQEEPSQAVIRELGEEVGYTLEIKKLIPLYVFEDPRVEFRYSNFLAVIPSEFIPKLNWETEKFMWVQYGQWPTPLHFGLKALIEHSGQQILNEIQKYVPVKTQLKQLKMDRQKYKAAIDIIQKTWRLMFSGGEHEPRDRFDFEDFKLWLLNEESLSRLLCQYGEQFYPENDEAAYEFLNNDISKILEQLELKYNKRIARSIDVSDPLFLLKKLVREKGWKKAKYDLFNFSLAGPQSARTRSIDDEEAEIIFRRLFLNAMGETYYNESVIRNNPRLSDFEMTDNMDDHLRVFMINYIPRGLKKFPNLVKIFRGTNSPHSKVRSGDFTTFDKDYARYYIRGKYGAVISDILPSKDLVVYKVSIHNTELIYWPEGHQIKKYTGQVPSFKDFWNLYK